MAGGLFIGTSGWMYDRWREVWYGKLPKRKWLAFCGERFTGIEVDASFYRQQETETFGRWAGEVPEDFRFAVRGHRFLTHNKKLLEPEEPLRRVREQAEGLGKKLAVMLWQLAPNFQKNLDRLEGFAKALQSWAEVRHALEFRHPSWFCDETSSLLGEYRLVNTQSDSGGWELWPAVTTDLVYLRFHGKPRTYASEYGDAELKRWAGRIRRWRREGRAVHAYFDNDSEGHAPHDAMRLMEMLG